MLGPLLLAASSNDHLRALVSRAPVSRRVVARFVPGETRADALGAITRLVDRGLAVTVDHLGEDTTDRAAAAAVRDEYVGLLGALAAEGLADRAEVSVKLSAVGQALPGGGRSLARDNAWAIADAARRAGTTMTLDMEDSSTVDSTLEVARELRGEFPWLGVVLQSALRRTEADCADLTGAGSRVRLVKGAYAEPSSVAFTAKPEVDASYRRCLEVLFRGDGYPMVGSHDPAMIAHAQALATRTGRAADSYEFQMLYGIRAGEQERLADTGSRCRVYLPYGSDWYGYFTRRLAERPANVVFFLRSFVQR